MSDWEELGNGLSKLKPYTLAVDDESGPSLPGIVKAICLLSLLLVLFAVAVTP